MAKTTEELIAYCRENGRVCPQPRVWSDLWQMLPSKKQHGARWEPPVPLILAAWYDTPAILKMARLAEHIRWAEQHGCLEPVEEFLHSLMEERIGITSANKKGIRLIH